VGVIIFNMGKTDFQVINGMKIAQLICEKIMLPHVYEVAVLEGSQRASSGFGSSDNETTKNFTEVEVRLANKNK
jgi:dUTP pyrophosphatase